MEIDHCAPHQIADLLSRWRLTDDEILDPKSWRATVLPSTRRFLERIRDELDARDTRLFDAGRATGKREYFDRLTVRRLPIRIGDLEVKLDVLVCIGFADVPPGPLEQSLIWGLVWWGKAADSEPVAERLRSLPAPRFEVKTIPGGAGSPHTSTTLLLHRALPADALRRRDEDGLVQEITEELKRLMASAQERSAQPALDRPLSAEALADWLQRARGLAFTPYQVAAFVTALQAKGFVILSGLSGTGKTQLAIRIAELVQGSPPSVIPVRPDWRDSRGLLGYYNPISERFASTQFLRELLQEGRIPPPRPSQLDPNRVRAEMSNVRNDWIGSLQAVVERMEQAEPRELTSSDLETIWKEHANGVASLGQASSHPLIGDDDQLREATARLTAQGTPGQRLIDVLLYLRELGNPWHWARALRALAVFDLDRTSAVVDREALRTVLAGLGYERSFDLARLVRRHDAAGIDAGFEFLRHRIDALFPEFDRFQKAVVPWVIFRQLSGAQTAAGNSQAAVPQHRFVILDEMNLARVEYYFAEFLSVLESDRDEVGVTTQALPLHSESGAVSDGSPEDPSANDVPAELRLPPLLYVVGTVNTDETTHAFSPKVLDRAFTIEFNDVDLARTGGAVPDGGRPTLGQELAQLLAASSVDAGREAMERGMADPRFLAWLSALYERLRPYDLHFGFRTRDEIARFVGYAAVSPLQDGFGDGDASTFAGAFDAAVLAKVLPKLHGPRAKLGVPLTRVLSWAISPVSPEEAAQRIETAIGAAGGTTSEALLRSALPPESSAPMLPYTARKAAWMLCEVMTAGFTSFS